MSVLKMIFTSGSYDIIIEKGSLAKLGELVKNHLEGRRAVVITDEKILEIYGDRLNTALKGRDFEFFVISIESGEDSKTVEVFEFLSNRLVELRLDRNDMIIAFGGGVVGDLAGFVAATYMRGISYIQVPTTLLAQVDSSVGGKTAINLPGGKNLVGAFHQPKAVLIDPELLETLEERVLRDGIGEVIKYGCISSTSLFERLEESGETMELMNIIEDIISESCRIKRDIVQDDEKEASKRVLLNFGHTLGHAIERYYNFKVFSHGEAVGIGMSVITENTELMGITTPGTALRIKNLLEKYGLPTKTLDGDDSKLLNLAFNDKKSKGSEVELVVLERIGKPRTIAVLKEDLHKYLALSHRE